jgi:O-antigen ligase
VTQTRSIEAVTAWIGRALFLTGVFWMLTGDWTRSTLLPTRWVMPLPFLAWPWLYLTLLTASLVFLVWGGVLRVGRPTTADFLHAPLALLTTAFLLSVALSEVPSLSEWAFGCLLAVVGCTLAVAAIVEDETCLAGISIAIAAAALCLAVRVILWRVDEGLVSAAYHVRNNAWLGKIQISWVLNLLAPFLLARYIGARGRMAATLYAVAWIVSGAAIYMLFSKNGVLTFPLTTLTLCALNARLWRRWLPLLAGITTLAVGLAAVSPTLATSLVQVLRRPELYRGGLERYSVLQQTVRMIADHPVFGIGFGTYDEVAHTQYGPIWDPHFVRNGWHAHNTALHLIAETGVVGFLAWCYLWLTILRFLLRRWRADDGPGRPDVSAGLGLLLAFFTLSLTESVTAARLYASLRMNLAVALLVVYGLRLAAGAPPRGRIP